MIVTLMPYCPADEGDKPEPGRDYGYAINECVGRLHADDWAFIIDHDMVFTITDWYRRLELAIETIPDAGAFTTCVAPASRRWCVPKEWNRTVDVKRMIAIGREVSEKYRGELIDVTTAGKPTAGIFLFRKSVWEELGGFSSGYAFIDNDFHNRIAATGRKIYLIKDVLLCHLKRKFYGPSF